MTEHKLAFLKLDIRPNTDDPIWASKGTIVIGHHSVDIEMEVANELAATISEACRLAALKQSKLNVETLANTKGA